MGAREATVLIATQSLHLITCFGCYGLFFKLVQLLYITGTSYDIFSELNNIMTFLPDKHIDYIILFFIVFVSIDQVRHRT